jgi:RimJ/RimL family protein N-acetyltransferase
MTNPRLRDQLLDVVPDDPVWIEARAVLLDSESRIFGDRSGYVVRSNRSRLAAIGGRASESLIREALGDIEDARNDPTALWAAVVPEGPTDAVRAALAGWALDQAHIHREPDRGGVSDRPVSAKVRPVRPADLSWLAASSQTALADELIEALARADMVATWVDGRPVSFCYAACESETLWDVSINTAAGYRRRGFATEAVSALAAVMRRRGKRAVWGAHSDNPNSRRLARKLGFEPWGRLCLFENWAGEPVSGSD